MRFLTFLIIYVFYLNNIFFYEKSSIDIIGFNTGFNKRKI